MGAAVNTTCFVRRERVTTEPIYIYIYIYICVYIYIYVYTCDNWAETCPFVYLIHYSAATAREAFGSFQTGLTHECHDTSELSCGVLVIEWRRIQSPCFVLRVFAALVRPISVITWFQRVCLEQHLSCQGFNSHAHRELSGTFESPILSRDIGACRPRWFA